jgi:hypothetical protein
LILAIIELLISIIGALEIAATACYHPDIIKSYDQWLVSFLCNPIFKIVVNLVFYKPVFRLWLTSVIAGTSFILAIFCVFANIGKNLKILAIAARGIQLTILLFIIIQIKYQVLVKGY